MNEVRNEELVRLSLRRELTPEEMSRLEQHFAAHPDVRAIWEDERALSRAVQSLPDVPVSSNFTSRVLQALDADEMREARQSTRRNWRHHFLPRFAWTTAACLIALFGIQQWRTAKQEKFAKDVSFAAADLAKLPSAEVLQDFDVIREMGQVSAISSISDDELLRVLQ
jgi:hypothetical protein